MYDNLMTMAKGVNLKLGGGADAAGRDNCDSYVKRPGEVVGIIKLVKMWHAIGNTVSYFLYSLIGFMIVA